MRRTIQSWPRILSGMAVILCVTTIGCATVPKPKTVGDVVGLAVDSTITWASKGVQKVLNK